MWRFGQLYTRPSAVRERLRVLLPLNAFHLQVLSIHINWSLRQDGTIFLR
jgi:hypothetical protein